MSEVTPPPNQPDDGSHLRRSHLVFGWWALFVFTLIGVALEVMHGFKVGWYLDVGNETRRLMMRLAHAHGTLFALINIAFALSVSHFSSANSRGLNFASRAFKIATILVPGGFFAGGLHIYDGDPGLGIILVPFGAVAMVLAIAMTARSASKTQD